MDMVSVSANQLAAAQILADWYARDLAFRVASSSRNFRDPAP
jgi:hypothetical protein